MKVDFKSTFLKEIKKLKDERLKNAISQCIIDVEVAENLAQIKNLKKLIGYENYYRLRVSNYRIGVKVIEEVFYFVCFEHRKDIYKKFP